MPAPRPAFGLHYVIPDDALSAWGMRTIVTQHGDVDVVYDRMGSDEGPHSKRLIDLLNERLPLSEIRESVGELLRAYDMQIGQAEDFILYMDDDLVVHANANSSYGYCYVTAWLVPEQPVFYVTVEKVEHLTYRVTQPEVTTEAEAEAWLDAADIETVDECEVHAETVSTKTTAVEQVDERYREVTAP